LLEIDKVIFTNITDVYKAPIGAAGFCLSILTIIALIHRSMETNEQVKTARNQLMLSTLQMDRQVYLELVQESNLAVVSIMRLQDRIFHYNSIIDMLIECFEFDEEKERQLFKLLNRNVNSIHDIYEKLLDETPNVRIRISQPIQQIFDATISGSYNAVNCMPENCSDVSVLRLIAAKMDINPSKDFENALREISKLANEQYDSIAQNIHRSQLYS
jgi:hypothetical protein